MARKRRSFPIPISTNYDKRDVQMQVIIDLVHKHPRGPEGKLTKEDYQGWSTDPNLRGDDNETVCGYKKVDLYRMIKSMSDLISDPHPTGEWDYRQLVREIFPDCGERGTTRRSRRFANRLGRAFAAIQRQGLPGIWNVNWGYNDTNKVLMHANNERDAVNQAKIFFGPIIGERTNHLRASFVREGSPLELLNANNKMLQGFDDLVSRSEEKIKQIREEIASFEMGKQFVEMYSLNCMSAQENEIEGM